MQKRQEHVLSCGVQEVTINVTKKMTRITSSSKSLHKLEDDKISSARPCLIDVHTVAVSFFRVSHIRPQCWP